MSHTSLLLFLLFFFVCLFFFLYVATCGRPGRRSVFRFFFFLFAPFCCLPLCLLRFFSFFFPFKLTRLSFFFFSLDRCASSSMYERTHFYMPSKKKKRTTLLQFVKRTHSFLLLFSFTNDICSFFFFNCHRYALLRRLKKRNCI